MAESISLPQVRLLFELAPYSAKTAEGDFCFPHRHGTNRPSPLTVADENDFRENASAL